MSERLLVQVPCHLVADLYELALDLDAQLRRLLGDIYIEGESLPGLFRESLKTFAFSRFLPDANTSDSAFGCDQLPSLLDIPSARHFLIRRRKEPFGERLLYRRLSSAGVVDDLTDLLCVPALRLSTLRPTPRIVGLGPRWICVVCRRSEAPPSPSTIARGLSSSTLSSLRSRCPFHPHLRQTTPETPSLIVHCQSSSTLLSLQSRFPFRHPHLRQLR
ncbi:hypothetical protein C8F01DRAFT_625260 [Mycena amicta]|nr:hypothetical protein C8F01DRAFT_625260 [Mycena amicta]